MPKHAWEIEHELRINAKPVDRREVDSEWFDAEFTPPAGDALIDLFWKTQVPGSRAPEIAYVEMVQAKGNLGFDVSEAERLLPEGLALHEAGQVDDLRALTADLMAAILDAPLDMESDYHTFDHPQTWDGIKAAMGEEASAESFPIDQNNLAGRIHQGWLGQLAGGSFGTAIEGYTSEQIARVYGRVDAYITEPETMNDDVVYELALMDAIKRRGKSLTSQDIAREWVRQIPFGWSAEWVALRNLNLGLTPPESGAWHNPYHDWIGGQMRGMICGMLAPAYPMEAARLAVLDGVVSHALNGVYGEIFAAVLTSLAFTASDPKDLIQSALPYIPQGSEYISVVKQTLDVLAEKPNPEEAWPVLDQRLIKYNWIHAYPNIAADLLALWYGEGDFTETMSLLALAGNDVDCNAGLVGNLLGIMDGVPEPWAAPIGDLLETYLKGKEKLSIRKLSEKTAAYVPLFKE
jgi:ADP-ribosylglycohydrolase